MHNIQTHKRGKLYNLKETNKKIGAYIHVSLSLRIINTVSCFISTMLKFNDFLKVPIMMQNGPMINKALTHFWKLMIEHLFTVGLILINDKSLT